MDVVADMGGEVMKIQWVGEQNIKDYSWDSRLIPPVRVVRVEELQQWVNDKKLDVVSSDMSYYEIGAYRLALTQLLDEIEVKP